MAGDETTGGHNGGSETGGNYANGGLIVVPDPPYGIGLFQSGPPPTSDYVPMTGDQAARALAWIRAHYGKPEFRCPEQPSDEP